MNKSPIRGVRTWNLSRATFLEDLYLLFPVTLEDLNKPRNKDVVALVEYLERLDKATLAAFLQDPTRFTPASASLAHLPDVGPRPMTKQQQRKGGNRHGHGATRRTAHLLPNSEKNCFLNSSLALALAAWDAQHLPDISNLTPAGGAFMTLLQRLRDSMFDGCALPQDILVCM